MSFFNTTNEVQPELELYRKKAETQDDVVLHYFKERPDEAIAPSQVWRHILVRAPLTSIRRSITNLTKAGKLEKTGHKSIGVYGRPEYCWRYKNEV